MPDAHFTLVFRGDIREQSGNPLHTDTPFGRPETVARGDVTAEFASLEDENTRMTEALSAARAEAEAARGKALEEAARIVEAEVNGVTCDRFVVDGRTLRTDVGHDLFVSTLRATDLLKKRAAAIRARAGAAP